MRKQRIVLKHSADVALIGLQVLNRSAVQADLSGSRIFETRDHSEGGGFAASRRTEQRKELPTGDVQGDAIHGVMCGIVLRNITKLEDALHCKLNVTSGDRRRTARGVEFDRTTAPLRSRLGYESVRFRAATIGNGLLLGGIKSLFDFRPVCDTPPRAQIFGAAVLIPQV